jgi:hypothetical protein
MYIYVCACWWVRCEQFKNIYLEFNILLILFLLLRWLYIFIEALPAVSVACGINRALIERKDITSDVQIT